MLLCKRLSDIHDEERQAALEESGGDNDFNLNIPRYVEPKTEQETLSVEEAMSRLRASAEAAFAAEEKLVGILVREGLLR